MKYKIADLTGQALNDAVAKAMTELKLCKDCKHYSPAVASWEVSFDHHCSHRNPELLGEPSPIDGLRACSEGLDPLAKRKTGSCGMDAKFWGARPAVDRPAADGIPTPRPQRGSSIIDWLFG